MAGFEWKRPKTVVFFLYWNNIILPHTRLEINMFSVQAVTVCCVNGRLTLCQDPQSSFYTGSRAALIKLIVSGIYNRVIHGVIYVMYIIWGVAACWKPVQYDFYTARSEIAKKDYYLHHVCRSASNNSAPTGQIFMECDIWGFFETLWRNFKFR